MSQGRGYKAGLMDLTEIPGIKDKINFLDEIRLLLTLVVPIIN
jgi:hypothetical protein